MGRRRRSPATAGPPRRGGRRPGPADRPGSRPSPARPAATPWPATPRRRHLRDDPAPSASTCWRRLNRPAVRALCSSWITSTCRCPPLQNRTVSASAGSIGSSGGGIDRSSSLSLVRTAHTRVRLSPSRTPSAGAPSPSRTSASRAWKNRSKARRSGRCRRLIRTSSTKAARKTPQSRPAERPARYRVRAAGRWSWVRRVPAAYDGSARNRSTIRVTRKYSLSTRWTCARPLSAARNHSSASPAFGPRRNCPDLNSFGEHRNPDRSAAISSTASPTLRSTLACVITGVAGSSRLVPENPDSSQAISTTAPATASTGGSPP